jgi:hypothetical protein
MPVDSLLLESYSFPQSVLDQFRIEVPLVRRQSRENRLGRTVFGHPSIAMGEERFSTVYGRGSHARARY